MGASLGGLRALVSVLSGLPAHFPQSIAVVLHRSKESSSGLVSLLEARLQLRVKEVADKDPIERGTVHIAPPDYHLLVDQDGFSLSTEALVNYARPAIDVLFESAADILGDQVVAVVLTGASRDGARGAAAVAARGGQVLVQAPDTAESPVMPMATIAEVPSSRIETLKGISAALLGLH